MILLLSEVIELAEERMYHVLYKFSGFQLLESLIRACYMCYVRLSYADSTFDIYILAQSFASVSGHVTEGTP
jgi:hypothetical protein